MPQLEHMAILRERTRLVNMPQLEHMAILRERSWHIIGSAIQLGHNNTHLSAIKAKLYVYMK